MCIVSCHQQEMSARESYQTDMPYSQQVVGGIRDYYRKGKGSDSGG